MIKKNLCSGFYCYNQQNYEYLYSKVIGSISDTLEFASRNKKAKHYKLLIHATQLLSRKIFIFEGLEFGGTPSGAPGLFLALSRGHLVESVVPALCSLIFIYSLRTLYIYIYICVFFLGGGHIQM